MPVEGSSRAAWEVLRDMGESSPWHEVIDEYTGDREGFHERHYQEFTVFLPYVQRFLYGEGRLNRQSGKVQTGSPMRVFRRRDIARVRTVASPGDAPVMLEIVHADLYFFFDVDLVLLNLEVSADELSLTQAQELLYRFGRAYPGGWDADGQAQHCLESVEWLSTDGQVLARSDAQQRELFMAHVSKHRAPRISAHWAFMLEPLVSDHSTEPGLLRFRQIEYYRMPLMGYLALDDPRGDRGVLAQFRYQHFLLFLIAHFQKATLLMLSDRLVEALMALDVSNPGSVRRFKRAIRDSFAGFLRFTHRYWFHEISQQVHVKALWHLCANHLELDALYAEVKERIADMNSYLDADSLRRQANTVVRLTVVTIFGLIGTVTTGFLGMNLISEADAPPLRKLVLFLVVFIPTIVLTFYTMAKSKGLSDFLDALSDEGLTAWQKLKAFAAVWRRSGD